MQRTQQRIVCLLENFAKVRDKKLDTKVALRGNHVACLLFMFLIGRLAMPSSRHEDVRHATLLYCRKGLIMKTVRNSILAVVLLMFSNSFSATTYTTTTNGVTWTYMLSDGGAVLGGDSWSCPAVPQTTTGALSVPEALDGNLVVGIGRYAFYQCESITDVMLPKALVKIDYEAFYSCKAIRHIDIPENVTTMGAYVFYNCTSLTNIVFGSRLSAIPNYAFYGCGALQQIVIPDNVTSIGSSAFSGCSSLRQIALPDNVTSIGSSVFHNCTGVTNVVFGCGLTSISSSAFSGCSSLRQIALPDNVTSIGSSAFYNCTGVTNVVFGCGLTSISSSAFSGCSSLRQLAIPDTVTSIGSSAFYNCIGLKSVNFGAGVTSIGSSAFYGCVGLCNIDIPSNVTTIGSSAFYNCSGLQDISIPSNIMVGASAFSGCSGLRVDDNGFFIRGGRLFLYRGNDIDVVIPNGVTSIEAYAFSGCSGIRSIEIPEGVEEIGTGAFQGCVGLADELGFVIIRNILYAYDGNAEAVFVPDGVVRIEAGAFSGHSEIKRISLPASLKGLANRVFEGCTGIETLNVPDAVTTIGASAFRNCSNLTTLILPANVSSLGSYPFEGCTRLKSLTIPQSLCLDGSRNNYRIFSNSAIQEIIIADGVTTIGAYAFEDSIGVTRLVIPNSVVSIGNYTGNDYYDIRSAFRGMYNLKSVTIPQVICGQGNYGLCDIFNYSSNIEEVQIAEGATSIGSYLFRGCYDLKSVTVASTITNIGRNAFSSCTSLLGIYFEGDAPNIESSLGLNGSSCIAYVRRGSSGWETDIPGYWQGIQIRYDDCIVTFDANGGEIEETSRTIAHDAKIGELPVPNRFGYAFLGWFASEEANTPVTSNTLVSCDVTYYAQWEKIVVATPVVSPDDGSTFAGRDCVVSISCATDGADIYYSVNGATPRPIDSNKYKGPFAISSTSIIRAVAIKDEIKSGYVSAIIEKREMTLAEAVDAPYLMFTTGDNAPWLPCIDESTPNGYSAISGEIGANAATWIETSVFGAGTLTFWWRVDCEHDALGGATWDRLMLMTNGVEVARIDGVTEWTEQSIAFTSDGLHIIRWVFLKDEYDEEEFVDAGWLCNISWEPTQIGTTIDIGGKGVVKDALNGYAITANEGITLAKSDIKIYAHVSGATVETTKGYKITVSADGKSAIAELMPPYEVPRANPTNRPWTEDDDGNVRMNIEVVPGLYYAAASAASLDELKCPGADSPATDETTLIVAKPDSDAQGFFKVWVSDTAIEAE